MSLFGASVLITTMELSRTTPSLLSKGAGITWFEDFIHPKHRMHPGSDGAFDWMIYCAIAALMAEQDGHEPSGRRSE